MKKEVLFLFLVIMLSWSVLGFTIGNLSHSIKTVYVPGEIVEGWINISLSDESGDSVFSNGSGSVTLQDFLESQTGAVYTCNPADCKNNYAASNGQASKIYSLGTSEEKLFGVKISGNLNAVGERVSFNITSNTGSHCFSPLMMDILDDNNINWMHDVFSDMFSCSRNKGCFNESAVMTEYAVDDKFYCQKVYLTSKGKHKLGGFVKKGAGDFRNLTMELVGFQDRDTINSCQLPYSTEAGSEVSCVVDTPGLETGDYYVCIKASTTTTHKIRSEEQGENCGFYNRAGFSGTYLKDYDLFVEGAKYSTLGTYRYNETIYNSQNTGTFQTYVEDFLASKYTSGCDSGCVFPINLISYVTQDVVISNMEFSYTEVGGAPPAPESMIYDITKSVPTMNSEYIKLDLEKAGFKVPSSYGNHTLTISLGGTTVVSQSIEVKKFLGIERVTPNLVPAAYPIEFSVIVSNPDNKTISSYKWIFGDGSAAETTTTNKVTHTYSNVTSYVMNISITYDNETESKLFTISGENPQDFANSTLTAYIADVNALETSVTAIPAYYREYVKAELDIDDLKTSLTSLKTKFEQAASDDEFVKVMDGLLGLNIPHGFSAAEKGSLIILPHKDINLNYLDTLGAGTYDSNKGDNYKEGIAAWNEDNADLYLDYEIIRGYWDDEDKALVSVFNVRIIPKSGSTFTGYNYLVLEIPSSAAYVQGGYTLRGEEIFTGLTFSDFGLKNINIAYPGEKDPNNFKTYLSPEFRDLSLVLDVEDCDYDGSCEEGEDWKNCRSDCKPWGWTIFWVILLLIIGFVLYAFLAWWYDHKYETHLFKNKNDIYNISNFIINGKNHMMSKSEIHQKLKQSGWSGEQINYAFKKIEGLNTGMWNPFNYLEKKKIQDVGIIRTPPKPLTSLRPRKILKGGFPLKR
ncbi:MAG: PKD domain-containing protein [Nanoarchaeota archaeon]|nr:PKD domain-containing protein [Nanoarchaeota archaeon]